MVSVVILLATIIALFFLSREVNSDIFGFFYLLFGSKRIAMMFTTLLFFPGTVAHELSHLFMAEILWVHTGKLDLVPDFAKDRSEIMAGSVEIAKSDPFRRTMIGLAPLIFGLIIIILLAWQISIRFAPFVALINNPPPEGIWSNVDFWLFLLFGYLLFTISNSMFPSREDMVGVTPVILLLLLLTVTAYLIGFRVSLNGQALAVLQDVIVAVRNNLLMVLLVNAILFVPIKFLVHFVMKKSK